MGMKACPNAQPHNKQPCTFNLIIRWGSTSYCQFPAFALGYIAHYFLIWSSQYTCSVPMYILPLALFSYILIKFFYSHFTGFFIVYLYMPHPFDPHDYEKPQVHNLLTIQTIMYTLFVWERSYEDFISQTAQKISIYSIVIAVVPFVREVVLLKN